ncbi:MAG: YkgJ family cysteine cluster protein [Candidatus Omnitrophica bacterium]|nr:YkgJ family cysteine cluster protein [Candidatus Omnitrophota bacterium]
MWQSVLHNLKLVWTARGLGWKRLKKIIHIAWHYEKLDGEVRTFRKKSKVSCIKGCGKCCENVYLETSTIELLPLALVLWNRPKRDLWLRKLKKLPSEGRCVFYQKSLAGPGQGRCRIYHLRPLMCRLFGYAAKKNKFGNKQWVLCNPLKGLLGMKYVELSYAINKDLSIPSANDYRMKIQQVASGSEARLQALPDALYDAMSVVSLLGPKFKNQKS